MNKILLLITTSRPMFWIIAPFLFLFALVQFEGTLTSIGLVQLILLSFPYNLMLLGINDVYDYKSDLLNPRKKLIEGIKLKKKYHEFIKTSAFLVIPVMLISSLLTFNPLNTLTMSALLFFSYYYSATPIRLKERPPLDSISNGLGVFLIYLLGFSFTGAPLSGIGIDTLLLCVIVIAIHAFTTIADYSADKKAKVRTFATVFGKRIAAISALVGFVLVFIFGNYNNPPINYFLMFCMALSAITIMIPKEKIAVLFNRLIFLVFLSGALAFILEISVLIG